MTRVEIENAYADGITITNVIEVEDPPSSDRLPAWFEEVVWPQTGAGRDGVEACYTATVLDGPYKDAWYDWC